MKSYSMVQIAPDQWPIYKQLQLCMAQEEEELYPGSFQQECEIADAAWQSRLADSMHPLLFACQQGDYVGMIGARSFSPLLARMVSLYVIPSERRKGIASLLVESILRKMKEKGFVKTQLLVHIHAQPAIKLYERFDFEIIGKVQYYSGLGLYEQFLMERYLSK